MNGAEQAFAQLRAMLLSQRFSPGQPVRESFWAGRLGHGRCAIRAALVRLEVEGLVQPGAGGGYVAAEISKEDEAEVIEVRIMLETSALLIAARRHAPGVVIFRTLIENCDLLERLTAQGYAGSAAEADRRFHENIVELAGNRRLETLYRQLPASVLERPLLSRESWEQAAAQISADHRGIAEAVHAGDLTRASDLLSEHLKSHPVLPLAADALSQLAHR